MRECLGGAGGRGRLGGQVGGERGTCGLGLGEAGGERGFFGFELTEAGLEFGGRAGRGLGGGDGGGEVVALLGEDGRGAESAGEVFLGVGPGVGGALGLGRVEALEEEERLEVADGGRDLQLVKSIKV